MARGSPLFAERPCQVYLAGFRLHPATATCCWYFVYGHAQDQSMEAVEPPLSQKDRR